MNNIILYTHVSVPVRALDGFPLHLGLVVKVNLLNFHAMSNMHVCMSYAELEASVVCALSK